MSERFQQGPEFLKVSGQIVKNVEAFRSAGMLAYTTEKYPLNTSRIICEIFPRGVKENTLSFSINAHQETEHTIDPKPRLVLRQDAALADDLDSFLQGVDFNQLVLSAIANQRADIHIFQQDAENRQVTIVRAKASPDKLGSYKESARELIENALDQFPEGSNPTDEDLADTGMSADRYQRLSSGKEAVLEEIASEMLSGEEQDNTMHQGINSENLKRLDEMEAKAMQGKFVLQLQSLPEGYLLAIDAVFK